MRTHRVDSEGMTGGEDAWDPQQQTTQEQRPAVDGALQEKADRIDEVEMCEEVEGALPREPAATAGAAESEARWNSQSDADRGGNAPNGLNKVQLEGHDTQELPESDAAGEQGNLHDEDAQHASEDGAASERIARVVEKVAAPLAVAVPASTRLTYFDSDDADLEAVANDADGSFDDIMGRIPSHDGHEFGLVDGWQDIQNADYAMYDIEYIQLAPHAAAGSTAQPAHTAIAEASAATAGEPAAAPVPAPCMIDADVGAPGSVSVPIERVKIEDVVGFSSDRKRQRSAEEAPEEFQANEVHGSLAVDEIRSSRPSAKTEGNIPRIQSADLQSDAVPQDAAHELVCVPGVGVFQKQPAARLEAHPVLGRLHLPGTLTARGRRSTGPSLDATRSMSNGTEGDKSTAAGASSAVSDLAAKQTKKAQIVDDDVSPDITVGALSRGSSLHLDTKANSIAGSESAVATQSGSKQRVVWTPELHERFVEAVNAVGLHQAVPRTLIQLMNVDGLTSEHVKSHLQKYRKNLRKQSNDADKGRVATHMIMTPTMEHRAHGEAVHDARQQASSGAASTMLQQHCQQQQVTILPLSQNVAIATLPQSIAMAASSEQRTPKDLAVTLAGSSLQVAANVAIDGASPSGAVISSGNGAGVQSSSSLPFQPSLPPPPSGSKARREVRIAPGLYPSAAHGVFPADAPRAVALAQRASLVDGSSTHQGSAPVSLFAQQIGSAVPSPAQAVLANDVAAERSDCGAASSEARGSSVVESVHRQIERQLEMQERTMQLQLEMQMMVHRTVSLQRKLRLALERQSFVLTQQAANGEGGGSEHDFVQEHSRLIREQRAMQSELERQQALLKQQMDEQENVRQQLLKQTSATFAHHRPAASSAPSLSAAPSTSILRATATATAVLDAASKLPPHPPSS